MNEEISHNYLISLIYQEIIDIKRHLLGLTYYAKDLNLITISHYGIEDSVIPTAMLLDVINSLNYTDKKITKIFQSIFYNSLLKRELGKLYVNELIRDGNHDKAIFILKLIDEDYYKLEIKCLEKS